MLNLMKLAIAGSLFASMGWADAAVAQMTPPVIKLGETEYTVKFKFGAFADNLVELQQQPWYAQGDFLLATQAARQVYDCGPGSPFAQPACTVPYNAFGVGGSGFGGVSPWFVYDVEAGVAATAVGFSDIAEGRTVLRQINTRLSSQQFYAIATMPPRMPDESEAIPEPGAIAALLLLSSLLVIQPRRPS